MGTQHTGATDGPTETQPTTRRDRLDAAFDADAGTVTDEWAGAFIYTSWGYGQTNVNFAQIVEVSDSGKTVLARMVTANVDTRSNGTEGVLPEGDQYGESFRLHVPAAARGVVPRQLPVHRRRSRIRRASRLIPPGCGDRRVDPPNADEPRALTPAADRRCRSPSRYFHRPAEGL